MDGFVAMVDDAKTSMILRGLEIREKIKFSKRLMWVGLEECTNLRVKSSVAFYDNTTVYLEGV